MWRWLLLAGDPLPKQEGITCGAALPETPRQLGCARGTRACRTHQQIPSLSAPALRVLQDGAWTSGTPRNLPRTAANSFLWQPHFPGAREWVLGAGACPQEALVPADKSCAGTPTNGGIWEEFVIYLYCFFLYYPVTKILHLSKMFIQHIIWLSGTFYYFILHLIKHYQKHFF